MTNEKLTKEDAVKSALFMTLVMSVGVFLFGYGLIHNLPAMLGFTIIFSIVAFGYFVEKALKYVEKQ